jgi:serine/threonine protein kinase
MSLVTGTRFGVYEVLELIGAGGMGEVYRARDTKLQRDVALKSLPELFAADPERLARFKREAQVLASLNHPHIASIYGFEEAGGAHALILELVPGPTLGDRTAQGAVPLDEALPAARQIADALEAAHAQGIVHRDLKPANIKIRPDGTVKVLDFGLARAIDADPAAAAAAQTPTITSPAMTQRGIILGTAAYMSPEQARGKTVDKRSDIWAFGAVLYEMLAGKRAFEGEEISDTLANILKDQPDWKALPPNTPAAIRRLLRRCLEKDPKRRLHDISDARLELTETESVDRPAATIAPSIAGRERLAWGILVVSLTGLLAYALLNDRISTEVVRFQVGAPDNAAFGSNVGAGRAEGSCGAALAPDVTQIVFV